MTLKIALAVCGLTLLAYRLITRGSLLEVLFR